MKQVESQSHLNIFQLKTPVRAGAIDAKTIRDSVNDFEVGDTIFRGCQYEIFGVSGELHSAHLVSFTSHVRNHRRWANKPKSELKGKRLIEEKSKAICGSMPRVGAEHQIIPNSILMTQFASNE